MAGAWLATRRRRSFNGLGRREEGREDKRALREEPALARAPRHFVRMKGGPQ